MNHDGDLARAHALIDAAAQTGADAVKFQTYLTDELVVRDAAQAAEMGPRLIQERRAAVVA